LPDGTSYLESQVLGLHLRLEGGRLRLFDPATGTYLLTYQEAVRAGQEALREWQEEARARQEAEARARTAEARLKELEAELRQLRGPTEEN
jgi:ribosomal protein L9